MSYAGLFYGTVADSVAQVPTFRDANVAGQSTANLGFTATKPAAAVAGDILLTYVGTGNSATITPPAGWTQVVAPALTAPLRAGLWWAPQAVASTAFVLSNTGVNITTWETIAIAGAGQVSPIDTAAIQANASATTIACPGVAQLGSTGLLICFGLHGNQGAAFTPPAGMTERADLATGSRWGMTAATAPWPYNVAVPAVSFTGAAGASISIGAACVIKP